MARRTECKRPAAELRRRLGEGETYASIARDWGVGEHVVRYRARALRACEPASPAPSAPALQLALSHADIPLARIATAFGCRLSTVSRIARAHGLPTDAAGRMALMEAR